MGKVVSVYTSGEQVTQTGSGDTYTGILLTFSENVETGPATLAWGSNLAQVRLYNAAGQLMLVRGESEYFKNFPTWMILGKDRNYVFDASGFDNSTANFVYGQTYTLVVDFNYLSLPPPAGNYDSIESRRSNVIDGFSLNFTYTAPLAPTLELASPADGAVGLSQSSNLTLQFSEWVQSGAGNIVLTNTSTPSDTRTIAVTDATQISISGTTVTINPTADLLMGAHYAVTMASGVIKDLAGNDFSGIASSTALDFTTVTPTYSLTASSGSVNEGGSVTYTVATTNVAADTVLSYTLSGTGITTADISGAALTGTATVDSTGHASFSVNLAADQWTEGVETLTATVQGQSTSVTVNDTSTTPVPAYAMGSPTVSAVNATSVNEGATVNFNLNTTNVASGTSLSYTLSGVSSADVTGGSLTGTVTVGADGKVVIPVGLVADNLTEGAETLTATVMGQSATVTVNDTSTTPVTTKYFVLPSSAGANFTDFDLSYGSVSLAGEQVTFVGSTAADAVFVRPGVALDFTMSGSGVDKIYLGGNFASYTASITGSVMSLQRGTGATLEWVSFIKSTSASSSDSVIFADGTLNSLNLYNNLKTATPLPALSTTETSIAPLAPAAAGSVLNASIKAFALNVAGDTFAPAHPGVAMTVVGSVGVDTVYVPRGGVVDCTLLGSGQDAIYFTGNWGDYTKAIAGSVVTFSRSVDGYSESVRVVGNPINVSLNDQLVFADGAVHSGDAKTALTVSLTAAISAVTGYDATLVTPGLAPTFSASAFNSVSNLEVGSNLVLNYRESVTAVSGKFIHIVNDGGTGFHGESTVSTLNILVTDTTQVSIVGGRVSLNPTADLDLANNYHITIDAGAFMGLSSQHVSAAYDGTSTLHFSTVTPGTGALATAAASQVVNVDGTLGSGHLWLDIEGIGSPSASTGTALDLAANHYALVAKDYNAAGGSDGYDGVTTGDFYVAANNFGAGDLIYIDNQGATSNDLTQTIIVNVGTPPTTVQFAGTGLGGLVDISLAAIVTTFDTVTQLKSLLGASTDPIFSDSAIGQFNHPPVMTSAATASFAENGTGTAYTATGTDPEGTTLSYALGGTDSTLFNLNTSTGAVTFKLAPNYEAPTDAGANNTYDITLTASDGVLTSASKAVAITVTDVVESLPGQSVIDLGSFGKLIAPVQVDGGNWYYYWDRSGDGSSANTGSLNGGVDWIPHNVLDEIFNQDINGVVNAVVANADGLFGTTDTYRYATINGLHLALPTAGGVTSPPYGSEGFGGCQPGTAVGSLTIADGSNAVNATYNDLLAVWDAYNGTYIGTNNGNIISNYGMPSGWSIDGTVWSATPSALGHAMLDLSNGTVFDRPDFAPNTHAVALQVLPV